MLTRSEQASRADPCAYGKFATYVGKQVLDLSRAGDEWIGDAPECCRRLTKAAVIAFETACSVWRTAYHTVNTFEQASGHVIAWQGVFQPARRIIFVNLLVETNSSPLNCNFTPFLLTLLAIPARACCQLLFVTTTHTPFPRVLQAL